MPFLSHVPAISALYVSLSSVADIEYSPSLRYHVPSGRIAFRVAEIEPFPSNLKLSPISIVARALQLLNIYDISVTDEVSKPLMSRVVKELQPSNILYIFVTDDVSKLLKSRFVKELQLPNIFDIFVTADVPKPLTSRAVKELQP